MKPCTQNRKLIVWLSLNALDAEQTQQLRAHLETCEGCRRYLLEISNVTEKLAAMEPDSNLQASESFHRRVAEKLPAAVSGSILETLAAYLAPLNWRVALPAIAALAVAGVMLTVWRHPPQVSSPSRAGTLTVPVSGADDDLAPTIANYQRVANQSLDKLDELLAKQGERALPPMPIYTASTFPRANGSF